MSNIELFCGAYQCGSAMKNIGFIKRKNDELIHALLKQAGLRKKYVPGARPKASDDALIPVHNSQQNSTDIGQEKIRRQVVNNIDIKRSAIRPLVRVCPHIFRYI